MSWSNLTRSALLAAFLASPAAAQDSASWQLGQDGKVAYADLPVAEGGRFTMFCRILSTGPLGGLGLNVPAFQTLVVPKESYGLTIVIDGVRDSIHMEARGVELWFEAKDLNQQMQLLRLSDSLKVAQRIEFGIATIGWRDGVSVNNSQDIDGLLEDCL